MAIASRVHSSLLVLARVAFPLTLMALSSCSGNGASSRVSSSGQTGSPNNEPPPKYDTPNPELPGIGGGTDGETGSGNGGSNMLPHPRPSKAHKVNDTLLLGGNALNVLDVSDPLAPTPVAQWSNPEQSVTIVSAPSLARVAVLTLGPRQYSESELPNTALSAYVTELVVLDVGGDDVAVVSRVELTPGSIALPVADGFTVLRPGAEVEPECGVSVGEIALVGPAHSQVSVARYTWDGSHLALQTERELGTGYFELSSDAQRAFFVKAEAGSVTGVVDALDLESLQPAYSLELNLAELDQSNPYSIALDERDGLTLITGNQRLLAYDIASGEVIATLPTPGVPFAINFETAQLATVDGAGGVVTVAPGDGTPSVNFVPRQGSARIPGYLRPFGTGFIEVSATNDNASYLTLTAYGPIEDGVLTATDELVTDIGYRAEVSDYGLPRTPWALDSDAGQLVLDRESIVADEARDQAELSLVRVSDGELNASDFVPARGTYGAPLFDEGTVYYASGLGLEAFEQGADPALPQLQPAQAVITGVVDRWFDVEHAGVVFTKHRNSYGATSLSTRASDASGVSYVEVPHVVDAIVPLDASHVVVLGLSVSSQCADGSEFSECSPNGGPTPANGISVLQVADGTASVVGSSALGFALGEPPPQGIERDLHWQDLVKLSDERVLLLASVVERCYSVETCELLGVEAHTNEFSSGGSSAGCAGEVCEPAPEPETGVSIEGSRAQLWLVPIDLSDPSHPVVAEPISGGARSEYYDEIFQDGVVGWLHVEGESSAFAYGSEQPQYNAQGNSVIDEHGAPVVKNFLQLVHADSSNVAFEELINLPGRVAAVGPAEWAQDEDAERSAFSLGVAYQASGDPLQVLRRLSLKNGYAYVQEELELSFLNYDAFSTGKHLALLAPPADVCEADAAFALSVIDLSTQALEPTMPLVLPALGGRGWSLNSWTPGATEPGQVYVFGGPVSQGRAVVDVTTNPPTLLRYETFDWR